MAAMRTSVPVLNPTGLGVAVFGDDPGIAIDRISSFFGPPDEDTGWVDPFSSFGTCPGDQARLVLWSNLAVIFISSSGGVPAWQVQPGETMWGASLYTPSNETGLALATPEGLQVGATVDQLSAAYPQLSIEYDDWLSEMTGYPYYLFRANKEVVGNQGLRGYATGLSGTDIVVSMTVGGECGE
jgi:hypothetical protein